MQIFYLKHNRDGYFIWFDGEIGPTVSFREGEIIVNWLNNNRFIVNSYSIFSYDTIFNEKMQEMYQIKDGEKSIGDPIIEKFDVVAIVTWINSCTSELKQRLAARFYEPIIGEEPTLEEINHKMKMENLGYYDALEALRKKKYKRC